MIGLGSGRTVAIAVELLAKRVKEEKLKIECVPTSYQIEILAAQKGLVVTTLEGPLDLAIDGADQVEERTLNMIKGGGAALLREKIVDSCAKKLVIVVDEVKLTPRLGRGRPLPVEILKFGYNGTLLRLGEMHGKAVLREGGGKLGPVVTDNGNFIVDVDFGEIAEPRKLDKELKEIPGVLETGLFLGMADAVYVGRQDGSVTVLQP